MKNRLDKHLADLYENEWTSYNSLALQTRKDTSTGMSVFDEPKETHMPNANEECNLELLDAEDADDNEIKASIEVEKPVFDPTRQYLPSHN